MRNSSLIPAASLAILACGGLGPEARYPPEAAPLAAALTNPDGPGGTDVRSGRAGSARSRFEAVLARDPERFGALNDLAVSYALDERLDAARALLDAVVAHGSPPEQVAALVNLGELYALDGYVGAALPHLETARSIDPLRPEPVYALALLADARGERERAAALVREAIRLDESGAARAGLVFVHPEERVHLEALLAEARGAREEAAMRWRELRGGRFSVLAAAARAHLED